MARKQPALDRGFGQVLRERRRALSLTQETLAARCDVHPTYISLLERGLSSPSLAVIATLAQELGTTAGELVAEAQARVA